MQKVITGSPMPGSAEKESLGLKGKSIDISNKLVFLNRIKREQKGHDESTTQLEPPP